LRQRKLRAELDAIREAVQDQGRSRHS
jgi:hypothetical protein